MVEEIYNIMKRNNIKKEDIDSIVVGIGPGSYTGVRIALTIAKTMGYVLKAKVYGQSGEWTLPIDYNFEKINGKWIFCN